MCTVKKVTFKGILKNFWGAGEFHLKFLTYSLHIVLKVQFLCRFLQSVVGVLLK